MALQDDAEEHASPAADQQLLTDDCVELGGGQQLAVRSEGSVPPVLSEGPVPLIDVASDDDKEIDKARAGDAEEACPFFFRVTHTGLGKKKHVEKGALTTYDLGIQSIPVVHERFERKYGKIYVLDISSTTSGFGTPKLATWMSESGVSFDQLAQHWRAWTPLLDQPLGCQVR